MALFAVLLSLLTAAPSLAATAETEPNNSTAAATVVPLGTTISGSALSADLSDVVDRLHAESRQLNGGYLVEMKCLSAPYTFYVATAVDGERHMAVGMLMGLPEFLGGSAPSREVVERSLRSKKLETGSLITEGTIHPWLNFPVEAL